MSKSKNHVLRRRELYVAAALILPASAFAAITPVAGGANVLPGNTPVVNIVAPNAAGVSHNRFDAFGVDASGVVLNNSVNAVKSQLAGQIDGNANFAGRAAQVIITEVTGKTATALNGAMEIAGQRAALVVANPNGISADGASFINASRVTLTTGTPQLDRYGRLNAINVSQGVISVTGKGLDATGAQRADLLARSVELNAKLQARQLSVVTGANTIGYANGRISSAEAKDAAPTVALDVAALGSMYADAIQMVGTENGVGVNIAGTIQASKGSVVMDAAGAVNVAASGALKAQADVILNSGHVDRYGASSDGAGVSVAGQLEAVNGSMSLSSTGSVDVAETGTLKTQRYANLSAGSGPWGYPASDTAGVNVAGKLDAGSLTVNSAGALKVAKSGTLTAKNDVYLRAGDRYGYAADSGIDVAGKVQATSGSVSASASGAMKIADSGSVQAQRDLYLSASDMDNAGAMTTVKGNIYARGPGLWSSQSSKFANTGSISAGGRAYVTGFDDKEVGGTVHTAKGDFLLDEYGHQLKSGSEDHTGSDFKAKWGSWMW
ncbi:filamentous hemagglutinin N-terminal domain-containing protein [Dyella sp. LX-66]|uniref:filamentous hemagglutinin N-terminal domain-containing protein n=1 Tax=unclassified Dyella TaxID=2634549 RepID=UPI001BDF9392|nr:MULTISPECIES: filamentous hemagglutinin N-terminal domain-containing protein [unclassified Dyella]MBT2116177.1 filamentous hemagglutinin N-terminal domain-containing protein [Dyella sp. LX-1]MBT2138187.1 filamentous hemagglutinin N-terminal domain-containing protein [Dyella sp. LX-66]